MTGDPPELYTEMRPAAMHIGALAADAEEYRDEFAAWYDSALATVMLPYYQAKELWFARSCAQGAR